MLEVAHRMSDPSQLEAEAIFEEAGQALDAEQPELTPKEARRARLANIAVLAEQNPHLLDALWEEVKSRRERYVRNLANKLVKDGRPVDQRELDFQRGVWYGQVLALVALPREAKDALAHVRDEEEEGVEP